MGTAVAVFVIIVLIVLGFQVVFNVAGLIIPVILWMLAGMFAGRLLRGRGYGIVGDILLGLAGGIIGTIVLSVVGLGGIGDIWLVGNIIVGVVGALILVWLVRTFVKRDFAR